MPEFFNFDKITQLYFDKKEDILKTNMLMVILVLALVNAEADSCDAPSFLLFRQEAVDRLDSLNQNPTEENLFERIVLMHNLGFHKDKDLREQAEKLLKEHFKKKVRKPIHNAYDGSLKMIKVSQRNKVSKVFRSIFGKSPYKEARHGFKMLTKALAQDSQNVVIRFVRATAATESVEYLPELFSLASEDLLWLTKNIDYSNSYQVFFLYLTWGKYYYKYALQVKEMPIRTVLKQKAEEYIQLAGDFVSCEYLCVEQEIWLEKVRDLKVK